jgi:hypothetical protein
MRKTSLDICIYTYIHTHIYIQPILDGNSHSRSLAKPMASPVFACLHTKQITVCIEGDVEGENYASKFERVSGIVCFTAMAGS